MAKKKIQQSAVSNQPSLEPGQGDPAPTQPAVEDIGYTVGLWAWKDQYRCKQCEFDTLNLDAMLEHLVNVHAVFLLEEPEPAPPPTPPHLSTNGEGSDKERADGIFEIDLKEDQ